MTGSDHITGSSLNPIKPAEGSPTVRFASANEEIEPVPLDDHKDIPQPRSEQEVLSIKELSQSLQNTQLQGRRMSHFAFEPVSLPASRVCLVFLIHICHCPSIRTGDGQVINDLILQTRLRAKFGSSGYFPALPASLCLHMH